MSNLAQTYPNVTATYAGTGRDDDGARTLKVAYMRTLDNPEDTEVCYININSFSTSVSTFICNRLEEVDGVIYVNSGEYMSDGISYLARIILDALGLPPIDVRLLTFSDTTYAFDDPPGPRPASLEPVVRHLPVEMVNSLMTILSTQAKHPTLTYPAADYPKDVHKLLMPDIGSLFN